MEQRKIEFRYWDGKDMIQSDKAYEGAGSDCFVLLMDMEGRMSWNNPYGFSPERKAEGIVMQWTGLRDKNNVKIFEGDIVSDSLGIGVVYFYAPQFIAQCPPTEDNPSGVFQLAKGAVNVTKLTETEVVGNVFQHSDILQ